MLYPSPRKGQAKIRYTLLERVKPAYWYTLARYYFHIHEILFKISNSKEPLMIKPPSAEAEGFRQRAISPTFS